MKKSLLLLIPLILGLGACTDPKTPDTPDIPDWGDTASKTIVFKGDKNRSGLGSGSQLGTSAFDTALRNLANEQSGNKLVNIGGQKCGTQLVGGDSGTDTSLTIGSYDGLIYFTFNLDIVKIDVTVQNYYKPHHDYEHNVDVSGLDTEAEVTICSFGTSNEICESKKVDLSTEDAVNIPSERQETLELTEKTNTVGFFNEAAKHRTYIHSLTITYVVE